MFSEFMAAVQEGRELSRADITRVVSLLAGTEASAGQKADFLAAMAAKGETVAEIAGFAAELRALSVPLPFDPADVTGEVLDVCGTGGDRLDTFNISTTVALVCAAAGVMVAKHGNRAVTSRSGSADVLGALGIPVDLTPTEVARSLRDHRFAFLFAPRFHPAFKNIAPARSLCAQRGQHTLFNVLGPLLNPARPTAQLLGVSRPGLVEPMARTLQDLGLRRAMVVSGAVPGHGFLDELSTLGENTVAEFHHGRGFSTSSWVPEGFTLVPATLADLRGGDCHANAAIIEGLLRGSDTGPRRDAVLLNAGAALFVADASRSIMEGWERAADVLATGRGWRLVEGLRTFRRD